jgi:hypothetical protein
MAISPEIEELKRREETLKKKIEQAPNERAKQILTEKLSAIQHKIRGGTSQEQLPEYQKMKKEVEKAGYDWSMGQSVEGQYVFPKKQHAIQKEFQKTPQLPEHAIVQQAKQTEQQKQNKELLLAKQIYESATPHERGMLHLQTFWSPRGFEYVWSSIVPGGEKPEDVVIKNIQSALTTPRNKFIAEQSLGALFGSVPGVLATSTGIGYGVGGAVKGIIPTASKIGVLSKAGQFMLKHSKAVQTAFFGLAGGSLAFKSYSLDKYLRDQGVGEKRRLEILGSELSKDALSMIGFTAGFSMGMKEGLPIGYEKVKIPTAKGEKVIYKGIYARSGSRAWPLIGKTEKGWSLGTPKISLEGAKFKGFVPESPLETKIITENLKQIYPEIEVEKVKSALGVMRITEHQPSAFVQKEFIKQTKTLSEKGVKKVLEFAKKEKAQVYGSFGARAQMPSGRTPADIDVQLSYDMEKAMKKAKQLVKELKAVGENVRISPKSPLLIEAKVGGKWHHAVDIHSFEEALGYPYASGRAFGLELGQRPIKIEKIRIMRLSEHGIRKGASSITLREGYVAPEPHRFKDIPDFIKTQEVLIESMKKSPLAFLKTGKIDTASKSLENFAKLFNVKKLPTEIKLPVYSPKVSSPSPSLLALPSISKSIGASKPSQSISSLITSGSSVPSKSKSSASIPKLIKSMSSPSKSKRVKYTLRIKLPKSPSPKLSKSSVPALYKLITSSPPSRSRSKKGRSVVPPSIVIPPFKISLSGKTGKKRRKKLRIIIKEKKHFGKMWGKSKWLGLYTGLPDVVFTGAKKWKWKITEPAGRKLRIKLWSKSVTIKKKPKILEYFD